jgi:hypothetical protein
MTIGFWVAFWTALLVLALAVFAGLAVAVSIGGFFDVKAMFAAIMAQHRAPGSVDAAPADQPLDD